MSDIADLKSKIAIAQIKLNEATYEANLDLVKRRKEELAKLEDELEALAGKSTSLLTELASASTEEEVLAVIEWAIGKITAAESLEAAISAVSEMGTPHELVANLVEECRQIVKDEIAAGLDAATPPPLAPAPEDDDKASASLSASADDESEGSAPVDNQPPPAA